MNINYIKEEKLNTFNLLIKENDITKLFLMRLQVYKDKMIGKISFDEPFNAMGIHNFMNLSHLSGTLNYKIQLSQEIANMTVSEVFRRTQYNNQSYISSLLLDANEKLQIYSTLDAPLFCYYLWAHTIKERLTNEIDLGINFPDEYRCVHTVNEYSFNRKLALFHEQRKLIIIFELETNINNPLNILRIKDNWRKICSYGNVIKLDENNPEFVEWVFQYTINFIETDAIYNRNNIKINPLFYQQIVTTKDKIETCYTIMNMYIFRDFSYLTEFKKKISLAIAQQERRNRAKKSLSPVKLSKKHEEKLRELSKYQKIPKQKMLEELIDRYYDNITKI